MLKLLAWICVSAQVLSKVLDAILHVSMVLSELGNVEYKFRVLVPLLICFMHQSVDRVETVKVDCMHLQPSHHMRSADALH